MKALETSDTEQFSRKIGSLITQWKREAQYRSSHLLDQAVPAVWEFCEQKMRVAKELGIQEELMELCRQAICQQMGMTSYTHSTKSFCIRNEIEFKMRAS